MYVTHTSIRIHTKVQQNFSTRLKQNDHCRSYKGKRKTIYLILLFDVNSK